MLKASIDLSPLTSHMTALADTLTLRALGPTLEASVADHYAAQPVPVETGRLRRALTQKPKTPERRLVVVGHSVIEVRILVPYARYQLRRLAVYEGRDIGARLSATILARLGGGVRVAGIGGAP
jgi:hypothetical protein